MAMSKQQRRTPSSSQPAGSCVNYATGLMKLIRREQKFEPEKEAGERNPDREGFDSRGFQSAGKFGPEGQKPAPNELEPLTSLLRENQKLIAIGRLTASIAHEINNPLESISNLLFLLGREEGLSTNAQSYLALAQQDWLSRNWAASFRSVNKHSTFIGKHPIRFSFMSINFLKKC